MAMTSISICFYSQSRTRVSHYFHAMHSDVVSTYLRMILFSGLGGRTALGEEGMDGLGPQMGKQRGHHVTSKTSA